MPKWYAGADHAGAVMKDALVEALKKLGDEVVDFGTHGTESVDYPLYGEKVGKAVVAEPGTLGLIVCGTGIGISIAANKVKGVRAAVVHDDYSARLSREHNDANVVALGARMLGPGTAESAVVAFRAAQFAGGRHQRRIDQIKQQES